MCEISDPYWTYVGAKRIKTAAKIILPHHPSTSPWTKSNSISFPQPIYPHVNNKDSRPGRWRHLKTCFFQVMPLRKLNKLQHRIISVLTSARELVSIVSRDVNFIALHTNYWTWIVLAGLLMHRRIFLLLHTYDHACISKGSKQKTRYVSLTFLRHF